MKQILQKILPYALGVLLTSPGAIAQSTQPVPVEEVAKQEQMFLSPVKVGNAIIRPPILDLYAICTGAGKDSAALVDLNKDSYPDIMRFYGGALATSQQWSKLGPSLLAPLRQMAEMRAQAQVAKTVAVYIAAQESLTESTSSTMTLEGLSTQINTDVLSAVSNEAKAYIKGARVTNVKVVSLGPDQGICVVVRYDVPLDGNGLRPETYNVAPESEAVPASDASGGGYTLPPPGESSY